MARAVESADKVVVSVKRSYEGGLRTVLDVLNAEQQAQQARRDLGEARLLYVRHFPHGCWPMASWMRRLCKGPMVASARQTAAQCRAAPVWCRSAGESWWLAR